MMLWLAVLLVAVGLPSLGQSTVGPQYQWEQTPCDYNRHCDTSKGEVCWALYDGCYQGVCMCNPDTHVLAADGYCREFKYGNSACSERDVCLDTMECRNGTCQCPEGEMAKDENFCVLPSHRLLGQSCNIHKHTCLQMSEHGYTPQEVECSASGRCVCAEGYRQQGDGCKKLPAGASCTLMYECVGGFMCLHGQCLCPNNYRPVAENTKCANVNAIHDLPLGAHCDEINETGYCATGLVCHRCHRERRSKCVRYSLTSAKKEFLSGSGSAYMQNSPAMCLALALVGYLLINSS